MSIIAVVVIVFAIVLVAAMVVANVKRSTHSRKLAEQKAASREEELGSDR